MITKKTCIVLGAGASVPYGLPTGPGLRRLILDRVARRGDKITAVLEQSSFDHSRQEEFVQAFEASRQPSVDAFLAHRSGFIQVGKAAIAAVLIRHEIPEKLRRSLEDEDDWYQYLWTNLQSGGAAGFAENQLSVVSFNYDRSFQQFLVDAYHNSFGAFGEEAFAAVSSAIPFVQVHGSLGLLSNDPAREDARPYSQTLDPGTLKIAAAGIRLLLKTDSTSHEFDIARRFIADAEQVVLLGCAYHVENMDRLGLRSNEPLIGPRLGSGYLLTQRERDRAESQWGITVGAEDSRSLRFLRELVDLD